MLSFEKIDHVHVYVADPLAAEEWYKTVLNFHRVKGLEFWFTEGGPLIIENGGVHLALFKSDASKSSVRTGATVAFSTNAQNYFEWQRQLGEQSLEFKESDHDLSWSLYFSDPDGNPYEITTYDYNHVVQLKSKTV